MDLKLFSLSLFSIPSDFLVIVLSKLFICFCILICNYQYCLVPMIMFDDKLELNLLILNEKV